MNYSLAYIKSIWTWLVTLLSSWSRPIRESKLVNSMSSALARAVRPAETKLWYTAPEWLSPSDKLKWVWASESTAYWKALNIHSPEDLRGLVR